MSAADVEWMRRHFPTLRACRAADEAILALSDEEPMRVYLDAWIAAYRQAGGRTDLVP